MTTKETEGHRYGVNQICVFTNRRTSGITSNDDKRCQITRLKPAEEWVTEEPAYVIEFIDGSNSFGVRECELQPAE